MTDHNNMAIQVYSNASVSEKGILLSSFLTVDPSEKLQMQISKAFVVTSVHVYCLQINCTSSGSNFLILFFQFNEWWSEWLVYVRWINDIWRRQKKELRYLMTIKGGESPGKEFLQSENYTLMKFHSRFIKNTNYFYTLVNN